METNVAPVVLVAGAAGGLGQVVAETFLSQGWRVAAGWHRSPLPPLPPGALPVGIDVTSSASALGAVREVVAAWGRLDGLVNCVGLAADAPVWQMTESAWDDVMAANLTGAMKLSQAVAQAMVLRGGGHIVHVGSYAGKVGARGQTNYAAAKAGLVALVQSLAREWGADRVRVNVVLPGALPTPMLRRLPADVQQAYVQANVLGRLNSVEEVARFIVFLTGMQDVSGQSFQLDSRISRWT